jgi:hypothetical protein
MNYFIERGREVVQSAPELFIDIDIEADGVAGQGSLLSIGAVDPWGESFYRELKPVDEHGFLADYREFNDTHGMEHDRLLREGATPAEAMADFAKWAKERRAVHEKVGSIALVGFNASYDFPMVNLEFVRAGIDSPFGHAGYCVKSLAMGLRRDNYSWKQTGKGRLPAEVLPEGDFTHHALEDAQYQQAIHYGLVGLLQGPRLG